MWRPLKGSDQPHMIHYVRALNQPARVNCLAVLRAGRDESVAALRRSLEVWRSLVVQAGVFTVRAATEPVAEGAFHRPAGLAKNFKLDLSKARQAEWDQLMADLPSSLLATVTLSQTFAQAGGRMLPALWACPRDTAATIVNVKPSTAQLSRRISRPPSEFPLRSASSDLRVKFRSFIAAVFDQQAVAATLARSRSRSDTCPLSDRS
jgi:hypothetical protein